MNKNLDFLNLDEEFSPQELAVRQNLQTYMTENVVPIIADCFENQRFPKEIIPDLAAMKVFGSTIQGYGCPGLNWTTYGLMMQEIERVDSGLRSFVSVQGALCMYPIFAYADEEIKKKFLPEMAQGKLIGCFGLTEPDFGSNPAGMQTSVRKEGNKYILNGHKKWLTNGLIADLAIIWAKDADQKIRGFVVPRDLPGVTAKAFEKRLSLRASISSEYIFENVEVPESHALNIIGMKGPLSCLNHARYGIAWGVLGAAQDCYFRALSYVKNRSQFSKPLASHQLVQAKLVEMFTEITLAQLLVTRLGRLKDQDLATPEQISLAKMNNVSKALKISRIARDLLGANGILGDYHIGRHMMNLESVNTYEGTEDIHRLILGQMITGHSAFV